MDFWDLERMLWQMRGPGPDAAGYAGSVQHAWYSPQHHQELAEQTPPSIVDLVRINGNRKVATFIADEETDGESYNLPDKVYIGVLSYGCSLGAPADQVPIGFDSNNKPEGWIEEPDPEE